MDSTSGLKRATSTPKTARPDPRKKRRYDSPAEKYTKVVPITPMPSFKDMGTPEVEQHAQKYGLKKRLGKAKLRSKLAEVYLYSHQTCSPVENSATNDQHNTPDKRESSLLMNKSDELVSLDLSDSFNSRDERVLDNASFNSSAVHTFENVNQSRADQSGDGVIFSETEPKTLNAAPGAQPCEVISLLDSSNEDGGSDRALPTSKNSTPLDRAKFCCDTSLQEDFKEDDGASKYDEQSIMDIFETTRHSNVGEKNVESQKHFGSFKKNDASVQDHCDSKDDSREVISLLDESDERVPENEMFSSGDHASKQHHHHTSAAEKIDSCRADLSLDNTEPHDSDNEFQSSPDVHMSGMVSSVGQGSTVESAQPFQTVGHTPYTCESDEDASASLHHEPDETDSKEEAGSDHEQLHRSLFVSKYHDDFSRSGSSSCSDEEEECKTLMQRLQEKRKLNQQTSIDDLNLCKKAIIQSEPSSSNINSGADKISDTKNVDFINNNTKDDCHVGDAAKKTKTKKGKPKNTKLSAEERNLAMYHAICSDDEIYSSVLQYRPVYLSRFKILMAEHCIKVSTNDLLDFLDNQGITFSTADENKGPRLKNRRPKKKVQ